MKFFPTSNKKNENIEKLSSYICFDASKINHEKAEKKKFRLSHFGKRSSCINYAIELTVSLQRRAAFIL